MVCMPQDTCKISVIQNCFGNTNTNNKVTDTLWALLLRGFLKVRYLQKQTFGAIKVQCEFLLTDRFKLANNAPFSTFDRDNDGHNGKVCTSDHQGGWWYARDAFCTEANLNGAYYDTYILEKTGIYWFGFAGTSYNTLKGVRMMLRKP